MTESKAATPSKAKSSAGSRQGDGPTPVLPWLQLLVICWVLGLCGLGVRSLLAQDARYGFGMLVPKVSYTLSYYWVYEARNKKGYRQISYSPGKELKGKASAALRAKARHSSPYGTGAVLGWVRGYARYMYEQQKPKDAVAFKAILRHRSAGERKDKSSVIGYPQAVIAKLGSAKAALRSPTRGRGSWSLGAQETPKPEALPGAAWDTRKLPKGVFRLSPKRAPKKRSGAQGKAIPAPPGSRLSLPQGVRLPKGGLLKPLPQGGLVEPAPKVKLPTGPPSLAPGLSGFPSQAPGLETRGAKKKSGERP